MGHCQLVTPNGSKRVNTSSGFTSWGHVLILDDVLVEKRSLEGPNMVLVQSMVNSDGLWIGWVRIDGFSLDVKPFKFLIIFLPWDHWSRAHNMLFEGLMLFVPLKLIVQVKGVVVNICQVGTVVLEGLMPSEVGCVEVRLHLHSCNQLEHVQIVVWQHGPRVLAHSLVESALAESASEALVNSIPMGPPHVANSILDLGVQHLPGH